MRPTGKVRQEQGWEGVESHGHRKASGLSVWGTFAQIKIITRNINIHTESKGKFCILTMLPHCIKKSPSLSLMGSQARPFCSLWKTPLGGRCPNPLLCLMISKYWESKAIFKNKQESYFSSKYTASDIYSFIIYSISVCPHPPTPPNLLKQETNS